MRLLVGLAVLAARVKAKEPSPQPTAMTITKPLILV